MAKHQFNEEAIKANLKSILEEIHDTKDPTELNELRRIFRSAVPLFSRAYVAAWLLKKAKIVTSLPVKNDGKEERRSSRDNREPKENQVSLFIGIGRTRRVYPRDLMGLLIDTCKLEKDDIGSIKILDNYSFVDINTQKAQGVIDTLNDYEFRGRSLSVNFAKKKD